MTLPTIAGVQSRIRTLPARPPFMIIREMAEVFGIEPRNLARQFHRTKHKFPEGYYFVLTPEEYREQLTKNWQTAERSRSDLEQFAFTEKGALFLLRFISSEQADAASIMLIDAFIALRDGQLAALRQALFRDETDYIGKSKMRLAISRAAEEGWTFSRLWDAHNWSAPKLGREIEEMRLRGFIAPDALYVPPYVYDRRRTAVALMEAHAEDGRQMTLFSDV